MGVHITFHLLASVGSDDILGTPVKPSAYGSWTFRNIGTGVAGIGDVFVKISIWKVEKSQEIFLLNIHGAPVL